MKRILDLDGLEQNGIESITKRRGNGSLKFGRHVQDGTQRATAR